MTTKQKANNVRSTIASASIVAHFLLLILLLQVLGMAIIAVLQYAVFNHITVEQNQPNTGLIEQIVIDTTAPLGDMQPPSEEAGGALTTMLLWAALAVIVVIFVVYIGKYFAAALQALTRRLYGRVSAKRLLALQLLLTCGALAIIIFCALLLPGAEPILLPNLVITLVCVLLFCTQSILRKSSAAN